MAKKKKHKLEKLKIGEVSMVGCGANQGAHVSLLKTDEAPEVICKRMFTDVMMQMQVSDELRTILDQSWKMGDALYDSFHSILMNPEIVDKKNKMVESFNQYISAMSSTITDTDVIKEIQKLTNIEGDEMPVEALKKEVEKLTKQAEASAPILAEALALASMNDVHKAYYGALGVEEKKVFIKHTSTEMDAVIAKVEEGKETYTTSTGTTICKSEVGDAVFAILKAQDDRAAVQDAKIAKQDDTIAKGVEDAVLTSFIAKAVTELSNLPGTPEEKGALLKSINELPEAQQTTALAMLKSGNETNTAIFKELGAGGEESRTAHEKLDALAKAKSEKDGTSIAKAYDAVLQTEEGTALYNETQKQA